MLWDHFVLGFFSICKLVNITWHTCGGHSSFFITPDGSTKKIIVAVRLNDDASLVHSAAG